MKKLVIFDLDGTLLNTIGDIAAATNWALSKNGFATHSIEEIRSYVGNGINKLFERALPEDSKTEEWVLAIRRDFIPYYNAHGAEMTMPYPGIVELLYTLQRLNIKIAVASNKYQHATSMLMSTYFPEIEFTAVYGQRDGIPTKPDTRIIDDILSVANTDKADTLYVGDSGVDMQTAANAALDAVGVTWGCRTRAELESFHPNAVVDTAEEILSIVVGERTSVRFITP